MADIAALQADLAAFEKAWRDLLMGKSLVEIRHGQTEVMRFTPGDAGRLRILIDDVKGQLRAAGVSGISGGRIRARRVNF